jgi:flagellar hook assembly protein FlgD
MVQVFDIMGKLVRVLSSGRVSAGEHRITLDGGTLASGIYFVRVAAAGDFRTSKIVFIR